MAPADIWTMHPSDKKFMLENIFPYLCRSPSKNLAYYYFIYRFRCQLEEMIEIIGDWEFPGNWGCIIPQIIEALGMEDDVVMYAGLCATYRLVYIYIYIYINRPNSTNWNWAMTEVPWIS